MKTQFTIGLFADIGPDHTRGMVRGMLDYLHEAGNIRISHCQYLQNNVIPENNYQNFDGIIAQVRTREQQEFYESIDTPVVNVMTLIESGNLVSVIPNNDAVGRLAAREFLSRGFKEFVYVGKSRFKHNAIRQNGFAEVVLQNGGHLHDAINAWASARELRERLKQLPKPLAVFARNDNIALTLINILTEDPDLNIPEEIAILGVDNDEFTCEFSKISISSIALDSFRQGREALSTLMGMIQGKPPTDKAIRILPRGVNTRQSTDTFSVQNELVKKVLQIIDKEACSGLRISDLPDRLFVSRKTLDVKFKEALQTTPAECVRQRQLREA